MNPRYLKFRRYERGELKNYYPTLFESYFKETRSVQYNY